MGWWPSLPTVAASSPSGLPTPHIPMPRALTQLHGTTVKPWTNPMPSAYLEHWKCRLCYYSDNVSRVLCLPPTRGERAPGLVTLGFPIPYRLWPMNVHSAPIGGIDRDSSEVLAVAEEYSSRGACKSSENWAVIGTTAHKSRPEAPC